MPAPLWDLFSSDRQLSCLVLNTRIGPAALHNWSGLKLDELTRERLDVLCKQSFNTDLLMHEPERWAALETLPPSERPLAMATRQLLMCIKNGKVGFLALGLESEDLLRHRHLVHIWIALRVTTLAQVARLEKSLKAWDLDDEHYLTGLTILPWVRAANSMRAALMEAASGKEDECLKADDVVALPDGREQLQPFVDWVRNDREVQGRVVNTWNNLVKEGRHRSLPPAISEQIGNRLWPDDRWIVPRCSPWRAL